MRRELRAVAADRSGMVALEFALIAPTMLAMWLGTVEVCRAVRADAQLYAAAEAAANVAANQLTSVQGNISGNNDICNAAKLAMYPYPTAGKLSIAIASASNSTTATQNSFFNDATYTYVNAWTVDWTNGTNVNGTGSCVANAGALVTNPASLITATTPSATYYQPMIPNPRDSVLVVQATYNYSFSVGYGFPGTMTLSQTVYTRPRNGATAPQ